jgi:hypothetical protein
MIVGIVVELNISMQLPLLGINQMMVMTKIELLKVAPDATFISWS